ncbi:MAG: M56 family metallopeptidase [Draconibacterium sp.]|nr:M56 family metallopeptidase [Draconibacterium sp.]
MNRIFLLGSVLFSVILPFLRFQVFAPRSVMLAEITVTPYMNMIEAVTIYNQDFSNSVEQAVLSVSLLVFAYFGGVIFFLGRFVFRAIQISLIIHKNEVQKLDAFKLIVLEKDISPYSFLDYIFVGRSLQNKDGYDRMILHELEHIKQGHSFDVIILELLTAFQWFNPFMWMLRRVIRENHEFLADQAVLVSGVNRGYYKNLLLNQFVGGQLVIANNFNYSLIKNRIKMMSKIKSSKLAITKITFGVLVAATLIIAFACEQKESVEMEPVVEEQAITFSVEDNQLRITGTSEELVKIKSFLSDNRNLDIVTDSNGVLLLEKKKFEYPKTLEDGSEIFFVVEEMPEFPGGDLELRKYIGKNVDYPEIAQKNGIQGKVYVTFVVTKNGTIANCKIARGVDPSLNKEALRVVNSLPQWKPGKQRGQAVNVSYTVPINFVLQK